MEFWRSMGWRREFLLVCCLLIGETGRCFQTRKKEQKRNPENYVKGSNIANHAWSNNPLLILKMHA